MTVDSYLELFTTLFGWTFYGILWDVLVGTGIVYLPFLGMSSLRRAAADLVSRTSGVDYDWNRSTVISAGSLCGILNVLLATLEPGDEVVLDVVRKGKTIRLRVKLQNYKPK